MMKAGTLLMRLIPVVMQIIGMIGMIVGGIYSASMIVGAGMGSPTGRPHDPYYATASWMLGIPAVIFILGWIWVVTGFLTAPTKKGNSISID